MKFLILSLFAFFSFSSFATRMCPVRTLEIVSCKEQGSLSISICEDRDGTLAMTYKHPARQEVEIYPASTKESAKTISFFRRDEAEEKMELVVIKSVDDHTRGVFKYQTAGVQAQLAFRCLTRLSL